MQASGGRAGHAVPTYPVARHACKRKIETSGALKSFADACSRQTDVLVDNSDVFAYGG
jgi:hypothetical protein